MFLTDPGGQLVTGTDPGGHLVTDPTDPDPEH
jgi:hypothetical protein